MAGEAPRDRGRPSSAALVGALCVGEILSMMGVFAFPALLPVFLAEWGLTNTQAGWLNGVYFAGYTAAVPVLASLTDRVDARRVYLWGAAAGALASAGFAFWAEGFWSALLFRALGGLGLAGTFIPGLKALVDRLEPATQGRAVAYYTAAFGLGTGLSFYAAGEIGAWAGWRWAFGAAGLGCVAALALAAFVLRPQPPSSGPSAPLLDFRPVLRNREAVAHILAYASHTWELFAFRSWAVAFLAFAATLHPTEPVWAPATVAAIGGVLATGANVCGGELALRFGRRRVLTAIMWGSAAFGAGLGFAAGLPYPAVALLVVGYNLLVQGDSSALHMGTVAAAAPDRRGTTMALQSLAGFATASVGPLVVGVVLDATGGGTTTASWGAAFLTMCAGVALGPLFLRLGPPRP
ncbi:MAG: MFS transporter [Deferrisomatales bacterium]|nr:MFS transporter [Deferrisomatales bacterium]